MTGNARENGGLYYFDDETLCQEMQSSNLGAYFSSIDDIMRKIQAV